MKLLKNQKPALFLLVVFIFSTFLSGYEYRKTYERKEFIRKYKSAKKHFVKAENKFRKGNFAKAEKDLENALKFSPCTQRLNIY